MDAVGLSLPGTIAGLKRWEGGVGRSISERRIARHIDISAVRDGKGGQKCQENYLSVCMTKQCVAPWAGDGPAGRGRKKVPSEGKVRRECKLDWDGVVLRSVILTGGERTVSQSGKDFASAAVRAMKKKKSEGVLVGGVVRTN